MKQKKLCATGMLSEVGYHNMSCFRHNSSICTNGVERKIVHVDAFYLISKIFPMVHLVLINL